VGRRGLRTFVKRSDGSGLVWEVVAWGDSIILWRQREGDLIVSNDDFRKYWTGCGENG
jgi:hypothetical protein